MTDFIPIESPGWSLEYGEPGHPLVVVLHDWYGRLPWLHSYAERLADFGFRVIVPDLYNGVATTSATTASQLRDGLDSAEHGVTPARCCCSSRRSTPGRSAANLRA